MISIVNKSIDHIKYSFVSSVKLETEEEVLCHFLNKELADESYDVNDDHRTILLDDNCVYDIAIVKTDGFFHIISINFFACGD